MFRFRAPPSTPQRLLKSDLAVWRLATEGRQLTAALSDRRAAEEALAGLAERAGEHEGKVAALRKQAAGCRREVAGLEKRLKKLQQDKDKKVGGGAGGRGTKC